MRWKPSANFIRHTVSLLLITVGGLYLWKDTVKPIVDSATKSDSLSKSVWMGVKYMKLQQRSEELAREQEKERELEREKQRALEKQKELELLRNPQGTAPVETGKPDALPK